MTICLENVNEPSPVTLGRLVTAIAFPQLKICLDVGHVNANSPHDLRTWLQCLGPDVVHSHLHNNFGVLDEHNGLAQGSLAYPEYLELIDRFAPGVTLNLEIRTDHRRSIEMVLDHIQKR